MKIECTLPNASTNINGIKFEPTEHGTMVSVEEVDEKVAERLLSIKGYKAVEDGGKKVKTEKKDAKAPVDPAPVDPKPAVDPDVVVEKEVPPAPAADPKPAKASK